MLANVCKDSTRNIYCTLSNLKRELLILFIKKVTESLKLTLVNFIQVSTVRLQLFSESFSRWRSLYMTEKMNVSKIGKVFIYYTIISLACYNLILRNRLKHKQCISHVFEKKGFATFPRHVAT